MEEKVLIKSITDKKVVSVLKGLMILFLLSALLAFFMGLMGSCSEAHREWLAYRRYETYFEYFMEGFLDDLLLESVFSFISYAFVLLFLLLSIFYLCYTKCELTITEKNIKGKSLFGKEVVLPIYMVSAFSTKKLFSVIAVATSSGFVKFGCIANYKEIGEVLTSLISERQENTKVEGTSSNLDNLKQLKELLDNGIITQEEFDAKKKQILGL